MAESAPAARRLTRLQGFLLYLLTAALALSFLSGILVWYGQWEMRNGLDLDREPTFSTRPWLMLHGWLNPLLTGLFGFLYMHHMRFGWRMRVNRVSGALLATLFGSLILTGTGLYYASNQTIRNVLQWSHQGAGVLLPVSLAWHWWAGRRWAGTLK